MEQQRQDDQAYKALIMIIDDNLEFLNGIQLTLEMEGYKVWTSRNGQEALNALKETFLKASQKGGEIAGRKSLPDIILADIMMPELDGYALYKQAQINPYLNHIPFIFLTAKAADEDIRYGKELGVDDYFSKLTPVEDLLASIQGKLKRLKQQQFYADIDRRSRKNTLPEESALDDQPADTTDDNGGFTFSLTTVMFIAVIAFALGWLTAISVMGGA